MITLYLDDIKERQYFLDSRLLKMSRTESQSFINGRNSVKLL